MSERKAATLSEREKRLAVGFAFFAEIVLGWFVLLDPPIARLARLEQELGQARVARDELKAASLVAVSGIGPSPEPLPPPLHGGPDEAAALTVQRHVSEVAEAAGVAIATVTVVEGPATSPAGQRLVELAVTGDYPAIDRFIGRLAWPDAREGIERLDLKPEDPTGGQVRADLRLLVELGEPERQHDEAAPLEGAP